jgi:uncharacterized membrane protein YesL
MKRQDIFNILFWIFLIIGIILLLWRIFGNSPTDLAIILPFILMLLFKMWSMSDNLNSFKHEVKFSFHKVRENINNLDNRILKAETKLKIRK